MFYIIYVFLWTAFALPKPTYSTTVNSASPFKGWSASSKRSEEDTVRRQRYWADFLSNSLWKYMDRMGILIKMIIWIAELQKPKCKYDLCSCDVLDRDTEKFVGVGDGGWGIIRVVVVTLRCLVLFFCEIKHFILEVEFLIKTCAGNSSAKICYFLRKSSVQAKETCS